MLMKFRSFLLVLYSFATLKVWKRIFPFVFPFGDWCFKYIIMKRLEPNYYIVIVYDLSINIKFSSAKMVVPNTGCHFHLQLNYS